MKILNGVRFFSQLAWLNLTGQNRPLTVIFNVTNRCNCRCKHCYASYFERDNSDEMTTQQAKVLMADLRANGCLRVSLSGGEPLLRQDIEELIGAAHEEGMSVTLNTNGILVSRRLEILKQVDALAISLDGRPEHHDLIRGQGTGERALEGIRQAVEAGIRVHVNMVITCYNLYDIDYMLNLARTWGFKAEFALYISNIFHSNDSDPFKPTNAQFKQALVYLIEQKRAGAPILFSAKAYQSVLDCWPDFSLDGCFNTPAPKGMPPCPAGRFFALIDADGTLWACPHLIGQIQAKNAITEGVAEAWKTANHHPCSGCYQVYHHEFSLLMNLNPSVVLNYVKNAFQLS